MLDVKIIVLHVDRNRMHIYNNEFVSHVCRNMLHIYNNIISSQLASCKFISLILIQRLLVIFIRNYENEEAIF